MVYEAVTANSRIARGADRRGPGLNVEGDSKHRDHRQGDPAHDDQIDWDREINSTEAPQHRRWFSPIAQLGELEIGKNARPAP